MSAKVPSGISDYVQNVPLMVDTTQLLKFKGDMSLTASKEGIILQFTSVNCQSISRALKQLLKVSARCRSQEYLFGKFSINHYQRICGRIYIQSNSMLSAYSSEHLQTDASEKGKLFFETYLNLDIQTAFTHAKVSMQKFLIKLQ